MKLAPLAAIALLTCCHGEPQSLDGHSIRGSIFYDNNENGVIDPGEEGIEGIVIFLDTNHDGIHNPQESMTISDASGKYAFSNLATGAYQVREEMPFGLRSRKLVSNKFNANFLERLASQPLDITLPLEAIRCFSDEKHQSSSAPAKARVVGVPRRSSEFQAGSGNAAIIGGSDVDANFYPFMASVGDLSSGTYSQFCGGALVGDRFVLTAAHCSEDADPSSAAVMLGSQLASDGGTVFGVSEIIIHPDWNGDISEGHDMALWKLSERVDLHQLDLNTVGMLLPAQKNLAGSGVLATTIGWGVHDNQSDALQEVHVPITSEDRCAQAYPEVGNFETQICAGASGGGLDSCQGDSGGPLLVRDSDNQQWMHAGITSWGAGCAEAGKPGIYARTWAMSSWAKEQMLESSLAFDIELPSISAQVDFANKPTIRPLVGAVPDRWSISKVDMVGESLDSAPSRQAVTFRFFLFTEPEAAEPLALACTFDPDGEGPQSSGSFPCKAGINQFDFGGYDDGIYLSRVHVESRTKTANREITVRAGEPPFSQVEGLLQLSDARDADYPLSDYYIDTFRIEGLQAGIPSVIEVDASFGVQLGLYDGDLRDSSGGGVLEVSFGSAPQNGTAAIQLSPTEGRTYLIGVSTLRESTGGSYTLRLVNSGTAVPFSL